jgi:hypothetical protein
LRIVGQRFLHHAKLSDVPPYSTNWKSSCPSLQPHLSMHV